MFRIIAKNLDVHIRWIRIKQISFFIAFKKYQTLFINKLVSSYDNQSHQYFIYDSTACSSRETTCSDLINIRKHDLLPA